MFSFIECTPVGGIGNQLFIVSTGLVQAQRLHCDLRVLPHKVSSRDTPRELEVQFMESIDGVKFATKNRAFRRFKETSFDYDAGIERIRPGTRLVGYFQSWRYVLPALESVKEAIGRYLPIELREPVPEPFIAVHLRRGDYLNPQQLKFHGVFSEAYYVNAVQDLRERLGPLEVSIFSDSRRHAEALAAKIQNSRIEVTPERPLYVLMRMARASAWVMSNSSFSWWAAMLGDGFEAEVVAPEPWFADHATRTRDLLPPKWRTLPDPNAAK